MKKKNVEKCALHFYCFLLNTVDHFIPIEIIHVIESISLKSLKIFSCSFKVCPVCYIANYLVEEYHIPVFMFMFTYLMEAQFNSLWFGTINYSLLTTPIIWMFLQKKV